MAIVYLQQDIPHLEARIENLSISYDRLRAKAEGARELRKACATELASADSVEKTLRRMSWEDACKAAEDVEAELGKVWRDLSAASQAVTKLNAPARILGQAKFDKQIGELR